MCSGNQGLFFDSLVVHVMVNTFVMGCAGRQEPVSCCVAALALSPLLALPLFTTTAAAAAAAVDCFNNCFNK